MRNAYTLLLSTSLLFTTACTTMNESLQLGAGLGAATGAAATHAAHKSAGEKPDFETVATGAGIGMVLGLITSYFTHNKVADDRERQSAEHTDIHFGDLPPSPFLTPNINQKGGR